MLARSSEKIDLTSLSFSVTFSDLSEGTMTGDLLNWTTRNAGVMIENGIATARKKGMYPLKVGGDGVVTEVYLFVKDHADEEYVLYEEDFSTVTRELPEGWSRIGLMTDGAVIVHDQALIIDGTAHNTNPTGVLLPKFLESFSNYKIEAEMTYIAVNNEGRWNSIMYRVQNELPVLSNGSKAWCDSA